MASPEREAEPDLRAWARDAFRAGHWESLADLTDSDLLATDTADGELLLCCAVGCLQVGQTERARSMIVAAVEAGASPRQVAVVLLSSVHTTMGRAAGALGDVARGRRHFAAAERLGGGAPGIVQDIREKLRAGQLLEAAGALRQELASIADTGDADPGAMTVFETQLSLVREALRLALKRGQLSPYRVSAGARGGATSQLGQDLWVLQRTGHKLGGYFVEIGAADGVLLSNTYLLESGYQWSGLCVEPNPGLFEELVANRTCHCAAACIAGETGRDVEFVLAQEFGTMMEYAASDIHADKRRAFREQSRVIRLSTTSLHDLLIEHEAPRTIDYLSIDTEGSEYEILSSFPFQQWDVRLVTVEHNFRDVRWEIRQLMEAQGFRCTQAQWDDWYYRDGSPT